MGNVLDCSSDPLDVIHEGSDADAPTEHISASYDGGKGGATRADGTRREDVGAGTRKQRTRRSSVLYLEKAVPLRDSIMWKLQREYYMAHHVQCWEKMVVPCFVTSNSFIARAYAKVLVGFMRDHFLFNDQADQSEPTLIVEVGSGHGKFAFLVLKHLMEMREFLPTLSAPSTSTATGSDRGGSPAQHTSTATTVEGVADVPEDTNGENQTVETEGSIRETLSDGSGGNGKPHETTRDAAGGGQDWDGRIGGEFHGLPFRYVVTDVAQGTLDYVRSHPSMRSFLDEGLLELALLDAEDPNPPADLHLQVSGKKVDLQKRKTPIVAVCNYVFDSLRQDAFRIQDATLYENRVSITAARPLPDNLSQLALNALEGLGLQWEHAQHAVPADRARAYYAGLENSPTKDHEDSTGNRRCGDADKVAVGEDGRAEQARSPENPGDEKDPSPERKAPVADGEMETGAVIEEEGPAAVGGDRELRKADRATSTSRLLPGGDSDFDGVLASYLDDSFGRDGGSVLMPLGGLRLLRHLSSLAGGRCLILAGDKGYGKGTEMAGRRDPHIAYHGSLSCMVNMDALSRYTRQRGGWALSSPYMEGFKCQALAFGMGKESLEEMRLAFEDATQEFGPESFSTLQRAVKDEVAQPSLWLVTQLLRLAQLDPDVFMKFRASLVQQVSNHQLAPPSWEDLRNDALALVENWYPLQQGKDVNFEVARLLMALKDFTSALMLFRRSDRLCGEHHVTCHNMGMSHFYLGNLKEAKACFERSLVINETYDDSLQWLAHVSRALNTPSVASAPREATAGPDSGARTTRLYTSEQPPVVIDPAGISVGLLTI